MPLADILIERIRAAGNTLKWRIELPDQHDDDDENGGKKYRIEAIDPAGEIHIVRGPSLTESLIQMAINLGFDLEG